MSPSAASGPRENVPPRTPAADRRVSRRLVVAPLLITLLLAMAWLVFSWPFQGDHDPRALVRALRAPGHGNWQTAYSLANLLRNPGQEALRRDSALCRELSSILNQQLEHPVTDGSQVPFRVFLCRALGEFEIPDGLPSLLLAVEVSRRQGQIDIQCAALEAIAILAARVGPGVARADPQIESVLLDASRAASDPGAGAGADRVASRAAFTLGVVGGPAAVQRLRQLLSDRRPGVRYNAATGLSRHRDPAAVPVLLEMLDSDILLSHDDAADPAAEARMRALMIRNAARALRQYSDVDPEVRRLAVDALQRLRDAPGLPAELRAAVEAGQSELQGGSQPRA